MTARIEHVDAQRIGPETPRTSCHRSCVRSETKGPKFLRAVFDRLRLAVALSAPAWRAPNGDCRQIENVATVHVFLHGRSSMHLARCGKSLFRRFHSSKAAAPPPDGFRLGIFELISTDSKFDSVFGPFRSNSGEVLPSMFRLRSVQLIEYVPKYERRPFPRSLVLRRRALSSIFELYFAGGVPLTGWISAIGLEYQEPFGGGAVGVSR